MTLLPERYPELRDSVASTDRNSGVQPPICYTECMTEQEIIAQQKQTIARAEYIVREQIKEIDRLRAEVDRLLGWINGDSDALTTLQSVYLNPNETPTNRVKAAASAIGYDRAKVVIQGYANITSLAQRLDSAHPRVIEHHSD
jgi:uncharacterized coiled-coil protein SlyX